MMKQWLSFRNICFIIFFFIFILYATRIIDFNPRLLPLIMLVSVYLLTCKNWKIFSKENRENFEESLGTIVIPANLHVKGSLTVDGATKCQDMEVANDITATKLYVTDIKANKDKHHNIHVGGGDAVFVVRGDSLFEGTADFKENISLADGKRLNMMNKAAIKFGAGEPDGQDINDGVIAWNVWAPGLNIVGKQGIDKKRHTQIWGTVDCYQDVSFPHVSCNSVTCTGVVYTHTINADSLKGHAWNATGHIYLPQGLIMRQSNGYEIRIWKNKISLMAPNGVEIPTGTLNTATINNSGAITAKNKVTAHSIKSHNIYTHVIDTDQLKGHAWNRAGHIYTPQGIKFKGG